ncbi:MAG: phosphate ABC transporter ATP-binding protein, partial [Gemmataceae bacterium]
MSSPEQLAATAPNGSASGNGHDTIVDVKLKALYYGKFKAVRDTSLAIKKNAITAFIGPSGCGKST